MLGGVYWHPDALRHELFCLLLNVTIVVDHVLIFGICVSNLCCGSKSFGHIIIFNSIMVDCRLILKSNIIIIIYFKLVINHPRILTHSKISESGNQTELIYIFSWLFVKTKHLK